MGFLSGPTPAESNPSINPEYFSPTRFQISDIVRGKTTIVTMTPTVIQGSTINPNYVIGQLVRFNIPSPYGIQQINEKRGYVISIPSSNQVEVTIDSSLFNPFIPSPANDVQLPQIIPVGDVNQGAINSSGRVNLGTYVPGSFINISPN